ncbi:MAG: Hint domain-containing protein [Pseudomonadota bacterium]
MTLLQDGSQTVIDDDGEEVTVTAVFNGDFFNSGGQVQSDDTVDTVPDSFTLTFTRPVENFEFTVGEVNSNSFAGGFNDRIEIVSTLDGAPVVTTLQFGTSGTTAVYEAPFNTSVDEVVSVTGPFNSITLTNFDPDQQSGWVFLTTAEIGDVVCFAKGSEIETENGAAPVESLTVGDLVLTRDHGFRPIRWVGKRTISPSMMGRNEKLRPVRIRAGALGRGIPSRDLLVSRQHRMLATSKIVRRMFGVDEILLPAIRLTALPGVEIADDVQSVEYFHLLFDEHEIIYAERAPTESMLAGRRAIETLSAAAVAEIGAIFPELMGGEVEMDAVRQIPKTARQKKLTERSLRNDRALVAPGLI